MGPEKPTRISICHLVKQPAHCAHDIGWPQFPERNIQEYPRAASDRDKDRQGRGNLVIAPVHETLELNGQIE